MGQCDCGYCRVCVEYQTNPKTTSVWILQGSTGEYSDRVDWIVRAYKDKEQATRDCSKANDQAEQYYKMVLETDLRYPTSEADYAEEARLRKEILVVDPDARFDYTGTTYWVTRCDLV